MRKPTVIFSILIMFLLLTSVASAAGPDLEPFSTTGYTTNLTAPPPGIPFPLVPTEFQFLPSGSTKLHISAQGGAAVDNDDQCLALYDALCQDVCVDFTGKVCGTDGLFVGGSFQFEEWAVVDQNFEGPNYGIQTISAPGGNTTMRFGGQTVGFGVQGSFEILDGIDGYKKLKGGGVYSGNAGYIFTVDYTPCSGGDCPTNRCAVFGEDFKVKKDEVKWQIANEGEEPVTISSVEVNWPESNGNVTKIRLGGKTIYSQSLGQPSLIPGIPGLWDTVNGGWEGKDKDREIKDSKKDELRVEFANKDVSESHSDYTIVVEFSNGCAVPFVAFE